MARQGGARVRGRRPAARRRHPRGGSGIDAIDYRRGHQLTRAADAGRRRRSNSSGAGSRTTRRLRRRIDMPAARICFDALLRTRPLVRDRPPALAADAAAGARRSARDACERGRSDGRARRLARGATAPDRGASGARRLSRRLRARSGTRAASARLSAIWSRGRTVRSATCRSRCTPARPRRSSITCSTDRPRRSIGCRSTTTS